MAELARDAHPFVVRLYATYADEQCVYLQLSASMGGDLYWLLSRLDVMRATRYDLVEIIARFHTASLTLALEHIHAHDVVYRDLKPENVLIDARGFVQLCDFGLAKKVMAADGRAWLADGWQGRMPWLADGSSRPPHSGW